MSLQSTRSSELARIAAEAAGADTSSVRFTVVHGPAGLDVVPPVPGQFQERAPWPSDFSLFSAAGLSMTATTWQSAMSTFSGPIQLGSPEPTGSTATCSYAGLTVPNPGFLKESTRRIDVLVTLGSTHWAPTQRDCLMNSIVIERLTGLAKERAGGPVLYLHSPAAPFQDQPVSERGDGSSERLRDAIGHCVRMSVGVDPNLPMARLDFEEGLVALAEEYGLGLKLDDRRFNRVRGEWFTIRGFDRERYRQERNRLFPDAPMQAPRQALVATVVGQARVGVSTQVIGALRANGIGILAASVSSMRGIGFNHFVLPVPDASRTPPPAWSGGWHDAMRTLTERCAGDGHEYAGGGAPVINQKFAISSPMRCTFPASSRRTGASTSGRVPYPLWLRWEVPHRTVHTPGLLADVQANLKPYTEQCEVAYAQSRLVRGDMIRGLAKLVVVLNDGHRDHTEAQRQLADVAERAQESTLKMLQTVRDIEAGRTRLRMSPRERWLAYAGFSAS